MEQSNKNKEKENRKYVPIVYLSALIILAINEVIFWVMKYFNSVEKSQEHHTLIISTSLVMVGFLLRATNMSVQARGNDKLTKLRHTKEWAIMDASIIVGEILFLIAGIWAFLTMVYKWNGDLAYSFQTSLFLSGVIYIFIVVITSRKCMKYLS